MRASLVCVAASMTALAASADAGAAPSRLRVVDLQTGAIIAQADARSWSYPVWRADGTLAATAGGRSVRVLPGGSIATVRGASSTALSPAGDRLATVLPAGSDIRVDVRALSGETLGHRRFRGSRGGLAWRRDGRRLAFGWSGENGKHWISILGRRGKLVRNFRVPATASFSSAAWAPDGKSLTFVTKPDSPLWETPIPREVRRLDLVTRAQTVLLRGTRCGEWPVAVCELLDAPAVAPDGARVAVVRDLNAVTLLGPVPAEATPSPQRDGVFDVAWTPDGGSMLVAYVEHDRMRLGQLSTTPIGAITRVVSDLGHTSVDHLTASPDGRRAAFSGTSDIDF